MAQSARVNLGWEWYQKGYRETFAQARSFLAPCRGPVTTIASSPVVIFFFLHATPRLCPQLNGSAENLN